MDYHAIMQRLGYPQTIRTRQPGPTMEPDALLRAVHRRSRVRLVWVAAAEVLPVFEDAYSDDTRPRHLLLSIAEWLAHAHFTHGHLADAMSHANELSRAMRGCTRPTSATRIAARMAAHAVVWTVAAAYGGRPTSCACSALEHAAMSRAYAETSLLEYRWEARRQPAFRACVAAFREWWMRKCVALLPIRQPRSAEVEWLPLELPPSVAAAN